jgi:response regulator RpfG family c-di-GMP phosphodiesterase
VLVVDDEVMVRRSLCKRLNKEGYYCAEASSAEEALELLESTTAELVILDIKMPGKSGREILPTIRQTCPDSAVIMSTAISDSNVIIECMKEGAQDYIIKPFDLDEVTESVQRAMQIRKLELEIKEYQQNLEQKVEAQTRQTRKLFLGAIESLVFALEAKDKYTAGHSRNVGGLSVIIGRELGLSKEELDDLRWGSLLHDVGKIAIDSAVQNKPGCLTDEEYRHVMTHSQVGSDIVKPVTNDNMVNMIRHHHDRYDGTAVNQALKGEQIPLGARIIAVADTFDAMTSDRPYHKAALMEEAIAEIKRCSGTQFDPKVVEAFLRIPVAEIAPRLRKRVR